MKKITLTILIAIFLLSSCKEASSKKDKITEPEVTEKESVNITDDSSVNEKTDPTSNNSEPKKVMLGSWSGELNDKKISIVIEKITDNEIIGYNIVGTNKRDLKGTFEDAPIDQPCAKAYMANLKEPGDDEWDGIFTIHFIGYEDTVETENGPDCKGNLKGYEAFGEWKSNNGKMKKEVTLTLPK